MMVGNGGADPVALQEIPDQAAFQVAPDKSRPFLIAADDRRIRVVGTEFNVLDAQGLVRVTVRHGVVGVTPVSAAVNDEGVLLHAGEQLEHRAGEKVSVVQGVDPEVAFAWRRGDLVYRDRWLMFGEQNAENWVIAKYGQNATATNP